MPIARSARKVRTALRVVTLGAAVVALGGASAWRARGHRAAEGADEDGGVVREPMAWGCSGDVSVVASERRDARAATRTPIPPPGLRQDLSDLKIGRAFPSTTSYDLSILPEQLAGVEREFCKRDDDLVCPPAADRERIAADLLQRTARIAAHSRPGSAEHKAAQHVHDDVRLGRLPLVQFTTTIRNGPTAAIIRYQDSHTGKWILGMGLAKDFVTAFEDSLFLDGVMVQELVHFDDLSFLPNPLRCYESNIEIRGHYAMFRYWAQQRPSGAKVHPRIAMAIRAGLDASSSRAAWYRYLNQVEKTDFGVEDELVTLEFKSLTALSPDRSEDTRFLGEISSIVGSALRRATDVRSHVARLSSDSINGSARVISAVSRLVPRVLRHYERARDGLRDTDGTPRLTTMGAQLGDIRRSLMVLNTLINVLAADPDFRRKSEFVGPE